MSIVKKKKKAALGSTLQTEQMIWKRESVKTGKLALIYILYKI